jgi:membrane glycosyltransferase
MMLITVVFSEFSGSLWFACVSSLTLQAQSSIEQHELPDEFSEQQQLFVLH